MKKKPDPEWLKFRAESEAHLREVRERLAREEAELVRSGDAQRESRIYGTYPRSRAESAEHLRQVRERLAREYEKLDRVEAEKKAAES